MKKLRRKASRTMVVALVFASLASLFLLIALGGEWWLRLIEYPDDFPSDPETGRGFRIATVYWMTFGGWSLLASFANWVIASAIYLLAWLGNRDSPTAGAGGWCTTLLVLSGGFFGLFFFRGLLVDLIFAVMT